MTTLRRFRALPAPASPSTARLIDRMRERHGQQATLLTVRAKPQQRRSARL